MLFLDGFKKDMQPWMPGDDILESIEKEFPPQNDVMEYFKRRLSRRPFGQETETTTWVTVQFDNTWVSKCYSCGEFGVWVGDELIYPQTEISITPNEEMPPEIKRDFIPPCCGSASRKSSFY